MEEQTKELKDYLIAIKKRKTTVITITLVIFLLTVIIAFIIPPKYKSSATILIEQQEIPSDLVQSTVTSYADQQIQTIQARVMTRTNLLKIIDKFNLYKNEREFETTDEIIEKMQDDVGLNVISADVVDPRTGRPTVATIAFSVSYDGEFPAQVQQVASKLSSLYLNENLTNRSHKAADTAKFFQQESARLSQKMSGLEAKLAKFKQDNADSLPELQTLNMQILEKMETDLSTLSTNLNSLNERRFYLSSQLAQMNPGNPSIPDAAAQLKSLQAQYATARAKYSSHHPDVIRLKRAIELLKKQTHAEDDTTALAEELDSLRYELKQDEKKYTPDHPDVIALKSRIASLTKTLQQALKQNHQKTANSVENQALEQQSDNPAYLTIQAQLNGVNSQIKAITVQRVQLKRKIAQMEKDLYKTPEVERDYLVLKRNYDNAVNSYQDIQAKKMQADLARQLESESKGERFTLIDPAALPEDPISPNRPAIIFLGLVLASGCGIGFAFVSDAISATVRGAKSIQTLLGTLPLSVIPYELNLADISRKKRIRKRIIILFVLTIIFALLFINFFITPLDVLWFRLLRKIELLTS